DVGAGFMPARAPKARILRGDAALSFGRAGVKPAPTTGRNFAVTPLRNFQFAKLRPVHTRQVISRRRFGPAFFKLRHSRNGRHISNFQTTPPTSANEPSAWPRSVHSAP